MGFARVIVLLVLVATVLVPMLSFASGEQEMVIGDYYCDPGSTVVVSVNITNITGEGVNSIGSAEINISFDPAIVQYESAT